MFSLQDQVAFAEQSGDVNPIHIDPVYARRSIAGRPVVHGIHLLLWVLEESLKRGLEIGQPDRIHVQFVRPAPIDETLFCVQEVSVTRSEICLLVCNVEGSELARVNLRKGEPTSRASIKRIAHAVMEPADRDWAEIREMIGEWKIYLANDRHMDVWPTISHACSSNFVALLASTSRLVGMQCPGLNSLYSELELERTENSEFSPEILRYEVLKADDRFKFIEIGIESACYNGRIRAFARPKPQRPFEMSEILNRAPTALFRNQRALVVGGSRGIGEVAAKALAASGAEVFLTYAVGKEDAQRVVSEIRDAGAVATCGQLDILANNGQSEAIIEEFQPTHLFYCATPFIFEGSREQFSERLLTHFTKFYVTGFDKLVRLGHAKRLRYAWYPSTVALNETPANMREYCVAKLEGEKLAVSLMGELGNILVDYPRLPRTATDQTNSLLSYPDADAVTVFLSNLPRAS
jgi:hypothetical protein